jgi:hypothetical protein
MSRTTRIVARLSLGLSLLACIGDPAEGLAAARADVVPVRTSLHEEVPETYHDAIRFRVSFGLRSDHDYVVAADRDREAFPNHDWGVPLSEAEAADLQRRGQLELALGPGIELAESNLSSAASIWTRSLAESLYSCLRRGTTTSKPISLTPSPLGRFFGSRRSLGRLRPFLM